MLEYCENYLLCLKTKTKKLNPSIHRFLLRARILPSYSHSDPGIYFKVRFGKKSCKSAIPAIYWNDGIQFHRIWLQGSQICQVLKGILKCKWKDVLLNEHIYKYVGDGGKILELEALFFSQSTINTTDVFSRSLHYFGSHRCQLQLREVPTFH